VDNLLQHNGITRATLNGLDEDRLKGQAIGICGLWELLEEIADRFVLLGGVVNGLDNNAVLLEVLLVQNKFPREGKEDLAQRIEKVAWSTFQFFEKLGVNDENTAGRLEEVEAGLLREIRDDSENWLEVFSKAFKRPDVIMLRFDEIILNREGPLTHALRRLRGDIEFDIIVTLEKAWKENIAVNGGIGRHTMVENIINNEIAGGLIMHSG
jgi:hypothetical protein